MRSSLALENVEVSLSNVSGGNVNRLSKLDSDLNFDELETTEGE